MAPIRSFFRARFGRPGPEGCSRLGRVRTRTGLGSSSPIHPTKLSATTRDDANANQMRPAQTGRAVSGQRQTGTRDPLVMRRSGVRFSSQAPEGGGHAGARAAVGPDEASSPASWAPQEPSEHQRGMDPGHRAVLAARRSFPDHRAGTGNVRPRHRPDPVGAVSRRVAVRPAGPVSGPPLLDVDDERRVFRPPRASRKPTTPDRRRVIPRRSGCAGSR